MSSPGDAAALVRALTLHRSRIVPGVRCLQARWAEAAAAIPDLDSRSAALSALREKGRNAEGTGAFALLAPRRRRPQALAAMTALQTAVDYLDTLDETGGGLERGLALHSALHDAVVDASGTPGRRAPVLVEDDGYLQTLLEACASQLAALPAVEHVRPALTEAVSRCGEGQSRTHAAAPAAGGDVDGLRAWAERLDADAPVGYLWWELAAGASSSVAAHALIAAAADSRTTSQEVDAIQAAYFPPIGALTVVLDDLVDRDADEAAGEHSYLAYCPDPEIAAARLGLLADRGAAAIVRLRRRPTHAAILAGVAAFYLSDPRADAAPGVRARLLASLGLPARLLTAALQVLD